MVPKIKSNIFFDLRSHRLIGFLPDNDVWGDKEEREREKKRVASNDSPENGGSSAPSIQSTGDWCIMNDSLLCWNKPQKDNHITLTSHYKGQRVPRSIMINMINFPAGITIDKLWTRIYKTIRIIYKIPSFGSDGSRRCCNSPIFRFVTRSYNNLDGEKINTNHWVESLRVLKRKISSSTKETRRRSSRMKV